MENEPSPHLGSGLLVDGDGVGVPADALPDRIDQRQALIQGKTEDRIVRSGYHDIHPARTKCPRRRRGSRCGGMGSRRARNLWPAADWVEMSGRRPIAPKTVRRRRTEGSNA